MILLYWWWWISSVQPTTSVLLSEFVIILERLMRSTFGCSCSKSLTSLHGDHFWRTMDMHRAKDRRQRETSCYHRINKQERHLSKERTKRRTKNFIDRVKNQTTQKSWRNSSWKLWVPCGRPTSVNGGRVLRRIGPGCRIGQSKKLFFDMERCLGMDVKVPSTGNPETLVWVNACTDEVQNCRQIAAINTVIPTENKNGETSEDSREPVAQIVTLIAKGKIEHEQPPIHGRSWSVVPCSRDLPEKTQSGLSKKEARLTRHARKRESEGAPLFKETARTWRKNWHRIRFSESTPVKHRKKYEVRWEEGSQMTGQQLY